MRAGSTRKRPGLIAAALAVTAMLAGCAGTSPEEGPGTETRVAEPTDGWDPA